MNKILIGTDPELFLFYGGIPHRAYGAIRGSKVAPYKVEKGALQVDGLAAEFNIDPAKTRIEFVGSVRHVMSLLQRECANYKLTAVPVAEFGEGIRHFMPKERELGCDPDWNAYHYDVNPKPDASVTFRTGSGHIHVGWTRDVESDDFPHFEVCQDIVRIMDLHLGVPSRLWDIDTKRMELYGKPGAFRPKPYGVEYRVLSNAWLNDDALIGYVYDQARHSKELYDEGVRLPPDYGQIIEKRMMGSREDLLAFLKQEDIALPPKNTWFKVDNK